MGYWTIDEHDDGVIVATYSNPPKNYFCADGVAEFAELIQDWNAPHIRVVVLTGSAAEGAFITHYSVEELLAAASDRDALRRSGTALNRGYYSTLQSLQDLPAATIAALNGDAMGGGLELALACDVRVAQNGDYRYGFPEVKLGITPGGSGTQRLTQMLGPSAAIDLMLRARLLRPGQAVAAGIVHEASDDALATAVTIAHDIAAAPPRAVAAIKRSVYGLSGAALSTGLQLEAANFLDTMLSDDAVAAMAAYVAVPVDKRRDWIEQHLDDLRYSGT